MNFCVVGAGAWGTAFAVHLARLGHEVTLVPRRAEQATAMAVARENRDYLPGFPLPAELRLTAELAAAVEGAVHDPGRARPAFGPVAAFRPASCQTAEMVAGRRRSVDRQSIQTYHVIT